MRRSAVLLATALAGWGCGDGPSGPDWSDLLEQTRQERAAWNASRPQTYLVVQEHDCFCPQDLLRPAQVRVTGEVVQSATWEDDDTPVEAEDLEIFLSVSQVFALIENAARVGVYDLDVTFDATLHYPTFVHIDYEQRTADDDRIIWMSGLVPAS